MEFTDYKGAKEKVRACQLRPEDIAIMKQEDDTTWSIGLVEFYVEGGVVPLPGDFIVYCGRGELPVHEAQEDFEEYLGSIGA